MSITFEEISATVVPVAPATNPPEGREESEEGGLAQGERIRAILLREKRRLQRLSDR